MLRAMKLRPGTDGFSRLVDSIYATAVRPEQLPGCLREIADQLGAVAPGLGIVRPDSQPSVVGHDVDPVRRIEWAEVFAPRLHRAIVEKGLSGVFVSSELRGNREFEELLADWAHPQGFGELLQGQALAEGCLYGLGLFREVGARPFGEEDKALVSALLPHLVRATQLRDQIGPIAAERDLALEALGSLGLGVILLDRQGRVLELSDEARRILGRDDGLRIKGERLEAGSSFRQLLSRAASDPQHVRSSAQLERSSGEPAYELSLVRLPRAGSGSGPFRSAVLALFVSDPLMAMTVDEQALREIHGLTPAESRVAGLLCRGLSVEQIAIRNRVAVGTVRNQVKMIREKTGAKRQGEIVGLLLSGVARLASSDQSELD